MSTILALPFLALLVAVGLALNPYRQGKRCTITSRDIVRLSSASQGRAVHPVFRLKGNPSPAESEAA